MKKLLVLTDADFIGGAETNYKLILPQLWKNGWFPIFVTSGSDAIRSYFQRQGMDVSVAPVFEKYHSFSVNNHVSLVNIFRTWLAVLRNRRMLRKLVREHQPAAIVSNSMVSHWLLAFANTGAQTRKVMHLHDIINAKKAFGLYGWGLHRIAKRMDAVISVSDAVRNQFSPELRSRINKIYNPAEASLYIAGHHTDRIIRVGMFARYTPWKGHRDFLEIAKAFPSDNYQFVCFGNYAGNEPYYEELQQLAAALPNARNITLNGFCYNAAAEMSKCDIILQLSVLPDASPKILVESNMCHVPVYGYEGGGVRELFEELSLAGVLVPQGDKEAMVKAISEFGNREFVFPDFSILQPENYFSRFEKMLV